MTTVKTSQTTPEKDKEISKEGTGLEGQGLDAKGFVDSPANEFDSSKNLQVDLSALNNTGLSPIQQIEAINWAKETSDIDSTQLLRVVDSGKSGNAHYSGLYFSVCGKELFYALSDWMLHKLIREHQSKCITPGFHGKSSQMHETSYPSPP